MDGIEMIGKVEGINGHDILKRVYSPGGVSPTLSTMGGGNTEPKIMEPYIVASRGRDPENPSDRTAGNPNLVQRLEPRKDGMTNTITTVQKDNYVAEPPYRIRKLTPKECWRLQGFNDEDFEKAEKMNSNTQLYKQAGNSICVNVLEAIFTNLLGAENG